MNYFFEDAFHELNVEQNNLLYKKIVDIFDSCVSQELLHEVDSLINILDSRKTDLFFDYIPSENDRPLDRDNKLDGLIEMVTSIKFVIDNISILNEFVKCVERFKEILNNSSDIPEAIKKQIRLSTDYFIGECKELFKFNL